MNGVYIYICRQIGRQTERERDVEREGGNSGGGTRNLDYNEHGPNHEYLVPSGG